MPLRSFTQAEDYHRKYRLKGRSDLLREMTRIYPCKQDFVNSTAVARRNGYTAGRAQPQAAGGSCKRWSRAGAFSIRRPVGLLAYGVVCDNRGVSGAHFKNQKAVGGSMDSTVDSPGGDP